MKKKLKVYYAKVDNMGDKLNKEIIKKCFKYEVIRKSYLTGEISGIGSGLGNYTYEENKLKNILKFLSGIFFPKVYIWGTGFIKNKEKDTKFYKKNIKICAVRGELSKKRVEIILDKKLDIPTGDAGILASFLINKSPKKKYEVGIIAHYKEQDEPIFKQLSKKFKNSIIIDVKDTPIKVTKKIAECKTIISSSLHGLIIADSFLIPNRHVVVTNKLLGDGFKFDDYYSAYGLKHEYTDLNKETIEINDITKNYKITKEMIEEKKREMLKSFPYQN